MITAEEKKAILAEVLELARILPPIAAGEFTIGEFAEAAGVCYATASRRLAEMAEEGRLLRRKVRSEDGREVWGFRMQRAPDHSGAWR